MSHTAHPTISQVFQSAGYCLTDPGSVRRLQAQHRNDLDRGDVEFLQDRMARDSDAALARQRGQRPSDAARDVDHAVLRVLAPVAHEIPTWRSMLERGESMEVIAVGAGVPSCVVTLALAGLSGRPDDVLVRDMLIEASRRWRAGADDAHVAEAFGRSTQWYRRARRSGRVWLAPERMHKGDIAEYAGVADTLVGLWIRRGLLPAPDGHDTRGRWWWRPSIQAWATDRLQYRCSSCAAYLPTRTGLRVHVTKMHPPQQAS